MTQEDSEQPESFLPTNKKLTVFVIDGCESMFSGGNQCDFRKSVQVAYSQILSVCCSGSLNHMIGVVVTNTTIKQNRGGEDNSFEWVKLAVPGSEEVVELKNFLDSDDIHAAFKGKFGGHSECNLGRVMWGCRKVMQLSGTSTRHHMIMFFTNQSNPFVDDKSYMRFKKLIGDFTCTSYRDRNGLTKIIKTPGEFHVALLCEDLNEKDRKRWTDITPMVFHGNVQEMETQAYKKTSSQRAFSLLDVEIAPGVKFGVGVYALASEIRPPTKQLLDAETESKVEQKTTYVTKEKAVKGEFEEEEEEETVKTVEKAEIKKSIKIGGREIVTETEEIKQLSYFDAKGIVLLGFKPISDIDLTTHLQPAQLLYPDETNMRGSVGLYSALLDRCHARKMAMICRFCSRSNQKVRLVALVPQKKHSESEIADEVCEVYGEDRQKKLEELRLANEYRHNAFLVVFLPYAEDLRDLSEQMQSPIMGGWPRTTSEKVAAAGEFVKKLTKPYTVESYYNPRLRSFNAMLIEAAAGQQTARDDCLVPYFKKESPSTIEGLKKPLTEQFDLDSDDGPVKNKRTADGSGNPSKKRSKLDLSAMTTREISEQGLLDKLTVPQLRAALEEIAAKPSAGAKKADLVEMIGNHFA